MSDEFQTILVETHGAVGLIRLNRPKALNALSDELFDELNAQLLRFDADPAIRCIVLTGSEKAFAAGADIKAMRDDTFPHNLLRDRFVKWEVITHIVTPTIAAVAGFALGGGCELAMMCDIVIAADTAKFGQPEINLGVIPGSGGTQRLARAVGKARTMDMVLTGRMIDAAEAERANLVARVVPAADLLDTALAAARTIASLSPYAVAAGKQAVNRAFETPLSEGVRAERSLFLPLFGTPHQREGMAAFAEKRKAVFE